MSSFLIDQPDFMYYNEKISLYKSRYTETYRLFYGYFFFIRINKNEYIKNYIKNYIKKNSLCDTYFFYNLTY